MRRRVALVAIVAFGCNALTACGSSHRSGATLPTKVIDITFNDSEITPNGTDIDIHVGQRIELDVTADAPGEIHVHSSPKEQEFEYHRGTTRLHVTPIQAPGQVVVESHTLDKTLFTLVAR